MEIEPCTLASTGDVMDTQFMPFDKGRLNAAIADAKALILTYDRDKLAYRMIMTLNMYSSGEREKEDFIRKYQPWYLLLALKWSLRYGKHRLGKAVELIDVERILEKMLIINDRLPVPSEFESCYLFFKNLSYQQFWLQSNIDFDRFLRQRYLFRERDAGGFFGERFARLAGISLDAYLELSYMLLSHYIRSPNEPLFANQYFSAITDSSLREAVPQYLSLISGDFDKISILLKNNTNEIRNPMYEMYEPTPLKRCPLWRNGNRYYSIYPPLLFHCLQDYVYDKLRADNAQEFMNKFGPIFEGYIGMGLEYLGCDYLCENELEKALGTSKLVDYLIVDQGSNIFIDAKGVEMSPLGRVAVDSVTVSNQIKNSIIKGIQQGCEAAAEVEGIDHINGLPVGKKSNYILIITHSELYIGTGDYFFRIYAAQEREKLENIFGGSLPVPQENIYFLSVDDFDRLIRYLITNGLTINDILEKAVRDDSQPTTRKYTFSMHLEGGSKRLNRLSYLVDQNETMLNSMRGKLGREFG